MEATLNGMKADVENVLLHDGAISRELLEDTSFDVSEFVQRKIAENFIKIEIDGEVFILSNDEYKEMLYGKGTDKPMGMIPQAAEQEEEPIALSTRAKGRPIVKVYSKKFAKAMLRHPAIKENNEIKSK